MADVVFDVSCVQKPYTWNALQSNQYVQTLKPIEEAHAFTHVPRGPGQELIEPRVHPHCPF